ncbi:cupin domain-containing protein [Alicyclobacillus kakegawensis]|uniref:cupin domain-containing protein n=1 Tax=Alicyclobacillus kakegawensis TaxID=392012 RepID=UPI000833888F|nr:cupin domain-containing protein [Alicyclobacillus kakegawensis]
MSQQWSSELLAFHDEVRRYNLGPLWDVIHEIITPKPDTRVEPYLWKWPVIRERVMKSGELITPERGGERRVIFLENPGLKAAGQQAAVTRTLYVGIQLLLPGEIAPSHRHSQSAVRFIIEGEGAYTAVEGEKIFMQRGDYILTPAWTWHDHGHEGDKPMIWMDGLDSPFIQIIDASFFEPHKEKRQPLSLPDNYSVRRYGNGALRPLGDRHHGYPSPLTVYPWQHTVAAMESLKSLPPDPHDGYAVEYINPANGQSADPRIGAVMQTLTPGMHTKAHRHLSSAVYHVVEGRGRSVVNGVQLDWEKGDFFTVPPWAWHEHANTGDGDAVLFSINDRPLMELLELERTEAYSEGDGHQAVREVFAPLT